MGGREETYQVVHLPKAQLEGLAFHARHHKTRVFKVAAEVLEGGEELLPGAFARGQFVGDGVILDVFLLGLGR